MGRAAAAPAGSGQFQPAGCLTEGTMSDRGKPAGKQSLGKREESCVRKRVFVFFSVSS